MISIPRGKVCRVKGLIGNQYRLKIMRKKNTIHKDELFKSSRFCTECGQDLDDFAFNPKLCSSEAAQKQHENCKQTGKFNGDICSRVFITKLNEEDIPSEDDLPSYE